jgi:hypothetical protein
MSLPANGGYKDPHTYKVHKDAPKYEPDNAKPRKFESDGISKRSYGEKHDQNGHKSRIISSPLVLRFFGDMSATV